MDIRCPSCKTLYEFNEARLKHGPVNLKCSQCGHVFRVEGRKGRPRTPRRWMLRKVPAGDILYFQGLSTLQKWIVDRKVTRDDEISKTGKSWKTLGSIGELSSFFQVADNIENLQRDVSTIDPDAPTPTFDPSRADTRQIPLQLQNHLRGGPADAPATEFFDPLAPGLPADPPSSISGLNSGDWVTTSGAPSGDWTVGPSSATGSGDDVIALEIAGDLAPPEPLERRMPAAQAGTFDDPLRRSEDDESPLAPWLLLVAVLIIAFLLGYAYAFQPHWLGIAPKPPPRTAMDVGPLVRATPDVGAKAIAPKIDTSAKALAPTPDASADKSEDAAAVAKSEDAEVAKAEDAAVAKAEDATPDKPDAEPAAIAKKADDKKATDKKAADKKANTKKAVAKNTPKKGGGAGGGGFDATMRRAQGLLSRGQAYEALREYSYAADARPNNIAAICGKGRAYMGLGQTQGAINSFMTALRLSPNSGLALMGLGDAYRRSGQTAKAIETYRRYLSRYAKGPTAERARRSIESLGGTPPPRPE